MSAADLTTPEACRHLRASDVMHRGVITCTADSSGGTAARILAAHRIHAVVVTAPASPPGLVTDREIADALYAGLLESVTAGELARPAPLVRLSDSVGYVLERIHEMHATHALAVDRQLRPVGVISVLDLIEAAACTL